MAANGAADPLKRSPLARAGAATTKVQVWTNHQTRAPSLSSHALNAAMLWSEGISSVLGDLKFFFMF
jgi:hypothetical protein